MKYRQNLSYPHEIDQDLCIDDGTNVNELKVLW